MSHPTESTTNSFVIDLAEKGYLNDFALRTGVCNILHNMTMVDFQQGGKCHYTTQQFVEQVMRSLNETIAINTEKANEQHYELPPPFFIKCLGDHLKYSCCYWKELEEENVAESVSTSFWSDVVISSSPCIRQFDSSNNKKRSIREQLTDAEREMLELCIERADIRDNMNVLELGVGWGSATLYMAQKLKNVKVVGISYSNPQRQFIEEKAREMGIADRVKIITCDVNHLSLETHGDEVKEFLGVNKFDRIYSCEMFEHMRNWERLLNRIRSDWMHDQSKLFLHYFSHKERSYPYVDDDWMAKHFFSGGIMPSHDMIKHLDETIGKTLKISKEYVVNGRHYGKTSEAWLRLMDEEQESIRRLFEETYGEESNKWYHRWRMFYLTVAEFFSFRQGTEWFVSHYLLEAL